MKNQKITLDFSIKECQVLKGIAIILIFLHNFCHWLPSATVENEYTFHVINSQIWLKNLLDGSPDIIFNFFSFWGHYGVPIFLFLSGYGLAKKYESEKSEPLLFLPFMKKHFMKLWKLLFLAALMHAIVYQGYLNKWLLFLFTFITNLIPGGDVIYGPWWFFSLIMQCYFIYAVCFYKRSHYMPYIVTFLSLMLLMIAIVTGASYEEFQYIRFNIFGWVLPFALGVILERTILKIPIWLPILSMILFFLSEFNSYVWVFSSLFLCFGLIPMVKLFNIQRLKFLEFIGILSPMIFVIHPLSRRVIFYLLGYSSCTEGKYISVLCYIFLTLISSYFYKYILNRFFK